MIVVQGRVLILTTDYLPTISQWIQMNDRAVWHYVTHTVWMIRKLSLAMILQA